MQKARAAARARLAAADADARHQAILARRASAYNVPIPSLRRLKENKTFDAASVIAIANCFDSAGTVAGTPFAPVAATSAWCLNQVPLGNSSTTRIGRRFANTALAIRATISSGSTGTLCPCVMMLVWDRNPNQGAAIPAFNTVLTSVSPSALTNKDNAPRFKILRRWNFEVIGNQTIADLTDKSLHYVDEFVKLKNKVTLLTAADTTGLLPDMVEGSLLLYCFSSVAAGTAAANITLSTRLYFDDQ